MRVTKWSHSWPDDKGSKSAGLLISILVRYPELASVNFDPRERTLKFTFLVRDNVDDAIVQPFFELLKLSLEVLSGLEDKAPLVVSYESSRLGPVTALEMVRDVCTLSPEEISMMISVIKDQFGDELVSDQVTGSSPDEELAIQEELIGQMLEDLKATRQDRDLIAVREDGRVLVFNK